MLPIAWAIIQTETRDSWEWFIQELQSDFDIGEGAWMVTD